MNKQRFENCWSVPQIQRLAISILNRKPALASCGQPFPPVSQCSAWTSQSQTIYLSQLQPSIAYVLAFVKEVNRAILSCCDKPLMTPFRFNQFLVGDHRKNSKRAPSRPYQVLRTSIRRDQGQIQKLLSWLVVNIQLRNMRPLHADIWMFNHKPTKRES